MSADRINIFPSRGAQTLMKGETPLTDLSSLSLSLLSLPGRLKGAQTGHRLLKKKADALQLKFRSILKKIIETKQLMGELMKEASFSLAEAKFASTGDLNQAVLQNVNKAQIKVKTKNDNVAGVNLPVFESYQDGADSYELAGLAKGGQQLKRMKVGVVTMVRIIAEL